MNMKRRERREEQYEESINLAKLSVDGEVDAGSKWSTLTTPYLPT